MSHSHSDWAGNLKYGHALIDPPARARELDLFCRHCAFLASLSIWYAIKRQDLLATAV